jgi:hypothetical protein
MLKKFPKTAKAHKGHGPSTFCQFNQHFMCAFFANILLPRSLKAKHFSFVILAPKFCTKNGSVKCWWNLRLDWGKLLSRFRTRAFFLVIFWLWTNFRPKNVRIKGWWNWHQNSTDHLCKRTKWLKMRFFYFENTPRSERSMSLVVRPSLLATADLLMYCLPTIWTMMDPLLR